MPDTNARRAEATTSLGKIFWVFFKIGLFTFGGGFAMLPVLSYELYTKRKWIDKEELTDIVSVSTVFPGAIAVNSAFLQGLRMRGIPGVIAAITGIITPSIIIILLIGMFLFRFTSLHIVQAFFKGAGAAITGQIAYAVHVFGRGTTLNLRTVGLTLAILVILFVFKVHPIVAILISGAVGAFIFPKENA